MEKTGKYLGSCFCGAVKFSLTGAPVAMGYCHCDSCRTWSASPVNAFTLWKPSTVQVTQGQDLIGTYSKTERSDRKSACEQPEGSLWVLPEPPSNLRVDEQERRQWRVEGDNNGDPAEPRDRMAVETAASGGVDDAEDPGHAPDGGRQQDDYEKREARSVEHLGVRAQRVDHFVP